MATNWIIPLWIVGVGFVAGCALLWLGVRALSLVAPQIAAVSDATAKETRGQLLFTVVLALGIVGLLFIPFLPFNTFGDDMKVMKDISLKGILLLSLILSVVSASITVNDELEGRTALTVLSKPVSRRQFVVGKWLGVLRTVAALYLVLGAVFLAATSFKTKFEAREMSLPPPNWQRCQTEMLQAVPPVVLAFFETVVVTSISVAASTRLAMIPNLMICATIYIVGHLLPLLVQSSVGKLPIVAFVGQFLSTILPVLEHFDIHAGIASGHDAAMTLVEWCDYLGWAAAYCLLYSGIMLLLSLLLFEDRDLA